MLLRTLLALLFFGCGWWATAPVYAQGTARRHLILFANKAGTPYTTSAPQQFLSARSIQRRQRQGISVIARDLPPTPAYVAQVRARGATVLYRTRWFNGVVVLCDSTVLAQVRALPFVTGARTLTRPPAASPPPPPPVPAPNLLSAGRSAAVGDYGLAYRQAAMIDAVTMHSFGYRGDGMHIALFDAGFPGVNTLPAFRPLIQEGRILSTVDFLDNDYTVFEKNAHGTTTLSCIAGNQPGSYIGIAPQASFHLFIVDDIPTDKPTEEVNWLLAAEYADSAGVDIISSSLVYFTMTEPFPDYTKAQMNGRTTLASRAATMASATGMLVVSSAGNSGIAGAGTVRAPADADSVLAVGAVDSSQNLTIFSSRGPTADGRIKPNIVTQGEQTAVVGGSGRISLGHGTSYSCPIAAGLAAGFWQANPTLTAQQVRQYLQASGSIATAPTNLFGWGIPHFRRAYDLANPTNPLPQVPALTLASFSPTSGPVGTLVTFTGTGLGTVTGATLGATALTNLTSVSASQLQATIPTGAASGTFTVTNPAGAVTSAGTFTITTGPPALTFEPATGSPGSIVLVMGTGFTASSVVHFNGRAATGTVYHSATQLTATVPAGATSGPLTATTGATVLTGNAYSMTTTLAPTIRMFSPTAAPVGSVVTLTGANFTSTTQVRFGSVVAPSFSVVSSTSLTVPVPAGAENARIYVLKGSGMAQTPSNFTLMLPPTISSFSPASGTPGAVVEIQGTNFTNTTDVTFGGVAAAFTVQSASQLTATVPAGGATGPLAVTTVAGTATSSGSFTVTLPPPPTISSFSPGAAAVGIAVVLTGTNFSGATQVRFNSTPAVSFTVNSATQLTATVPVGATTGKIAVLTAGGMAQSATTFQVVPVPTISSLFPASGSPGAVLLISGTGLRGATLVTIGGVTAAAFTVQSATQIAATIPVGAASGVVRVTTPGGTATSASAFSVTAPVAPQLTGFNPASGPVGTSVTITGANLSGTTAVRFGNTPAGSFTVNSATSVTATVPAGATTDKIYVLTGGGLAQSAASFTVVQPPTLTTFLPTSGTRGSIIVVQGTNLTGATSVTIGGAAATFTVHSAKQLTATVPNTAVSTPVSGPVTVTVTTAAGTATRVGAFTLSLPPPPTIISLSPASGTTGTRVALTGTNFVNVRQVFFGLQPAESFVVTTTATMTAQVPGNGATGPVYVVADGGLATSPTPFTVLAPPSISRFTPVRGPVGTVVTISGADFAGTTDVQFGGVAASSFVLLSASQLTATVPAGAPTGQVRVTTALGTGVSAGAFTVTAARTDTAGAAWLARQTFSPAVGAFPNPAHERVTVQLKHWPTAAPLPATADLCDALGRCVRRAPLREEAVPTAELPLTGLVPGLYFLRVGSLTGRVVVE